MNFINFKNRILWTKIILIFIAFALTYLSWGIFGKMVYYFFPWDSSGSVFIFDFGSSFKIFVEGIKHAYVFYLVILFSSFGLKKNKYWVVVFILPIVYLAIQDNFKYTISLLFFGLIAYSFGKILNYLLVSYHNKPSLN